MIIQDFTTAARWGYPTCAAEKEAAGIGTLNEAATSRNALAMRLFVRFGAPSYGRPNGRSRKARRCLIGSSNSRSVALPYWNRGWRFNSATEANTMQTTPHEAAISAACRALGQAQEALESHAVHLDHFYALFDAIDRLDGDRPLINSLAIIGTKLATHYSIITVPPIESVEAAQVGLRTFAKEGTGSHE